MTPFQYFVNFFWCSFTFAFVIYLFVFVSRSWIHWMDW